MIRIDSPYGRLYKNPENDLILPSVTTFLKATEKKPFSRKSWKAKLMKKGITSYEASVFTDYYIARGFTVSSAMEITSGFIDTPMPSEIAEAYMTWKSDHSSDRGTRLHDFLEKRAPVGEVLEWSECPEAKDPTTQSLVNSLWDAEILQNIKIIHAVETRLWWYSDGIGFAGTEDVFYETWDSLRISADWKSKDPKHYSHTAYDHEYRVQLICYAGARFARTGVKPDQLHINFAHTDGSTGEQSVISGDEMRDLWSEAMVRLRAWWATIGTKALNRQ